MTKYYSALNRKRFDSKVRENARSGETENCKIQRNLLQSIVFLLFSRLNSCAKINGHKNSNETIFGEFLTAVSLANSNGIVQIL